MKSLLALICILTLTVSTANAELFKWVDEQGKVHYSDQPAGEKAKSETKLNIPNQPAANTTPEDSKSWEEKELDFKKRRSAAADNQAKQQKEAQEAKTKRENCDKAKQNLSQLESIAAAYTYNEKTGRTYLNPTQRAEATVAARKAVADWCK